jgi:hypothetical protein
MVSVLLRVTSAPVILCVGLIQVADSATGDLTRSRQNQIQNPFRECQQLLTAVHNAAKYFRFKNRHEKLMQISLGVAGGVANIKPQLRLNTTRVASRHNEAHSVLRLWKGITLYVLLVPVFFSADAVAVGGSCMCALSYLCAAAAHLMACLQRSCRRS